MSIVKSDPYSQAPIFIRLKFGDVKLAIGTAFFYRYEGKIYLVSNWHNFSGRNPETKQPLSNHGGVPDRVACFLCLNQKFMKREWFEFSLNTENENKWWEHPNLRNQIDIGILPIDTCREIKYIAINDLPNTEMELRISHEVFVLGYPFGLTDLLGLPIWKRGSVASEPDGSAPFYLIDTATRKGMSGSPVILRYKGFYKYDDSSNEVGKDDWFGEGDKFVGIYSGRLGASQFKAQLGKVWKQHLIEEIIVGNLR